MPNDIKRELVLLQQLRASGDPDARREADHLQLLFHDRQMDALSQDVYAAAKGEGEPPQGWVRLTEHPELVSQYAAVLKLSKDQLLDELRPDASGFRAEIYIPQPEMQQAGFKPTLAFKGSSGEVITSDGKRHDTTMEDFAGNNGPQSVGLETDYYDRAMTLALTLKRGGLDFESTGHSLAGGLAAAAAAVTGEHATTFNAAGLNPITTTRFAQQNPGVIVASDLTHLITNYQVQGELLSDGVQNNFHNMDALRRAELGAVLKEAGDVLQRVPEARDLFARKLGVGLPPQAQQAVQAFVQKLATGDTSRMLHDLPLAAGQQHVLAAMTRDAQGRLVPRQPIASLPEVTQLATPLLESLAVVAAAARVGERSGEFVAAAGQTEARVLHAAGRAMETTTNVVGSGARSAMRVEGRMIEGGEHVAGMALAHARSAQAQVTAQLEQGLGQAAHVGTDMAAQMLRDVGHVLPEQAQGALLRQAARLEQAGTHAQQYGAVVAAADRQAGQADALAIDAASRATEAATRKTTETFGAKQYAMMDGLGREVRAGLDAVAHGVERTSGLAPSVFAATGATAGLSAAAALELNPLNYPRLTKTVAVVHQGMEPVNEAFERHLMMDTVTPSLDMHIALHERQAESILQRNVRERAPAAVKHDQTTFAPMSSDASVQGRTPVEDQRPARHTQPLDKPVRDFSDRGHPQHALYDTLKTELPANTTPEWLAHATAACYMAGIKQPGDLGNITSHGDKVIFGSQSLHSLSAVIDIVQSPPSIQQTMQQVQHYDQQQTHMMNQIHAQNAQLNQQAPTR